MNNLKPATLIDKQLMVELYNKGMSTTDIAEEMTRRNVGTEATINGKGGHKMASSYVSHVAHKMGCPKRTVRRTIEGLRLAEKEAKQAAKAARKASKETKQGNFQLVENNNRIPSNDDISLLKELFNSNVSDTVKAQLAQKLLLS